MHTAAKEEVKKIIRKPHALDNLERAANDILLILREVKAEREQDAIIRLIKHVVAAKLLWAEVSQNPEAFTKPTMFEGGLEIDALISDKDTADTFGEHRVDSFAKAITQIRNALAHGRDTKSANTILPTSHNFDLLRPWLNLIAVAAGEVVLYDAAH
jgi:hypothetical protein